MNSHLQFTLNVSYFLQLPMTQTTTTFSAREALTQLRAAPTLSQALTPLGCPLQGLMTQALSPQALLTQALAPQGKMDLELGPQAHQDQSDLTATSVSALTVLIHSTLFFFVQENTYLWLPHRTHTDRRYWLSIGELLQRSLGFLISCSGSVHHNLSTNSMNLSCLKACFHNGLLILGSAARLLRLKKRRLLLHPS
jgi:hypothetical protein